MSGQCQGHGALTMDFASAAIGDDPPCCARQLESNLGVDAWVLRRAEAHLRVRAVARAWCWNGHSGRAGIDRIAEAGMTKAIYHKQRRAASVTELKLYPNRSHWTCAEPGWEDVADHALDFAVRNARPQSVSPVRGAACPASHDKQIFYNELGSIPAAVTASWPTRTSQTPTSIATSCCRDQCVLRGSPSISTSWIPIAPRVAPIRNAFER